MVTLNGKSVCGGVAIGKVAFYRRCGSGVVKRYHVQDAAAERARFEQAKAKAGAQLQALYEKALGEVGEANAAIFEIHQMMLEDQDYCDSIANIIDTQQVNAEYAVAQTANNFAQMFAAMDDAYMQARAADVRDISERLMAILANVERSAFSAGGPVLVAAEDLAPSETIQMDKSKVLGFLTAQGSANSHTAILARTMNIPAVVDIGEMLTEEYDGKMAVVDGFTGVVYIDPDGETLAVMRQKQAREAERRQLLLELRGQENVTLDGQKVNLYANIGNVSDLALVLQNDAGGIGLFRSEFLYLENETFPTEEQQFTVYRQVAETMGGRRVIIRTLDIGADKKIGYFGLPEEENTAMGYRAIRICLSRPDIFKTQLRAICRASAYGKVAMMFPMITSVEEVREAKALVEEVKAQLRAAGVPFDEAMEMGIMIETPAAALISDLLAQEVDFFSIGTNDLTQYALAIDRQNQRLERFYNPHHRAVLRMIRFAAESAHAAGKWIGICGELGADPALTKTFLAMGIDELSVSPGAILGLRKLIRETDLSKDREAALRLV
ncbi:phosphoenolpyruvate--protein phosphotransferase [Anaerotruncus sp. AF02-27]|uniref:phosphoenolpyruvate--protein phosphotransferase n=1 Tax=Anaerotruncus TaxID=244127 RepID=UPI000E473CAB|nr:MULTISPECIES: phosphoenolpyruvate--protein phosphotransferase [Anaerotruncus]RGX55450.1 phosphoenolpyruvate--protein phosphotransferase [Anaerotruncus sp. AF02-27]